MSAAAELVARFGLSEDEVLGVFEADPLSVIAGELDQRPEVAILLTLTDELDEAVLRRWLRAGGARGTPIALLMAHNFAAFEDAVLEFRARGIVLRSSGLQPNRRAVD